MADAGLCDELLQAQQKTRSTVGRCIPTVGDGVDADLLETPCRGPAQQPSQMFKVAVNPTIGTKTDQVQPTALGQQVVGGGIEHRVGRQAAVLDSLADPHQFLANNATTADGEMAHLGIAHLVVR